VTDLTTICAWCERAHVDGEWIRTTHVQGFSTHGVCPACEARVFPHVSRESAADLNSIPGSSGGGFTPSLPAVTESPALTAGEASVPPRGEYGPAARVDGGHNA
jgi:hypothetical protein